MSRKAYEKISDKQKYIVDKINNDLRDPSNFYTSNCICKNRNDITISKIDRYGINIPQVLCISCGVLRSKYFMREGYLIDFYKSKYRSLYVGDSVASDDFFQGQVKRGKELLSNIKKRIELTNLKIVELGTGAGGIIYPMHLEGLDVCGYDFDENYLSYGKKKGLKLIYGGLDSIPSESVDVLILSHVFEHINEPNDFLKSASRVLKKEGFLVIDVPGILYAPKVYFTFKAYFQSAHSYNFHKNALNFILSGNGFKTVYSDEKCFNISKLSHRVETCEVTNYRPFGFLIFIYIIFNELLYFLKLHPFVIYYRYTKK